MNEKVNIGGIDFQFTGEIPKPGEVDVSVEAITIVDEETGETTSISREGYENMLRMINGDNSQTKD